MGRHFYFKWSFHWLESDGDNWTSEILLKTSKHSKRGYYHHVYHVSQVDKANEVQVIMKILEIIFVFALRVITS